MTDPKASERRDGPRIDLRLHVRYEVAGMYGEAEASDISPKGLRLESDKPVDVGTDMKLFIDAGDAPEAEGLGKVAWCRKRQSPTGKTQYDVGVSFSSDWLARDRGPLGAALARLFAMSAYEPARAFERVPVGLQATATQPAMDLEVTDLSQGGMRFRSTKPLSDDVRTGTGVVVDIVVAGGAHRWRARVAWVAGKSEGGSGAFGMEFIGLGVAESAVIGSLCSGDTKPERVTLTLLV